MCQTRTSQSLFHIQQTHYTQGHMWVPNQLWWSAALPEGFIESAGCLGAFESWKSSSSSRLVVQHRKDSRSGDILMNNPKMYLWNKYIYFYHQLSWVTHKKGFSQDYFVFFLPHDMHISGAIDYLLIWFDIHFHFKLFSTNNYFFQLFIQQKSCCKNFCCGKV